MQEFEVKFLDVNPREIEEKLAASGAQKSGEYFYRRRIFDFPDLRLDKAHSWIRLRDEEDKITLTFKKRLGVGGADGSSNDAGMEEIEVTVSDFAKTAELLFQAGLIEKHYAENRRVRWVKDGVEFDLDTYPGLDTYLEIESSSWEKVDEAILLLGLDPAAKKIFSAYQAYALKGIDFSEIKRATFTKGLEKRTQ